MAAVLFSTRTCLGARALIQGETCTGIPTTVSLLALMCCCRKADVADLTGREVEVPASVFQNHTPGLFFRCTCAMHWQQQLHACFFPCSLFAESGHQLASVIQETIPLALMHKRLH